MLRLPPFEYLAPQTLDEAVALLDQHGPEAMLVAGGTDLYPGMKRRLFTPKKLIGLRRIAALQQITSAPDSARGTGLTIGAGVTLLQVATSPIIQQMYPALAKAANAVSTPQLRSMGTIGGNLCVDTRCTYYNQSESWRESLGFCSKLKGHVCWVAPGSDHCLAVHSSDTAPVLIALSASLRLIGPLGERWIPVHSLYQNDGSHYLQKQANEILCDIHIPANAGVRQSYQKLRRRGSFDFPVLSVAVAIQLAEDETCSGARIVLGAVSPAPLVAQAAESILLGKRLTDEAIEAAAHVAYTLAKPLDNTDMTLSYRKQMVRVYVAKALKEAINSHV